MKIEPAAAISGHIAVPGDKSLSHRAVLLAAVGEGETRITGFGRSEDTEATIKAVRDLGVRVYEADPETLRVFGVGLRGLKAPEQPLDCGNAGTLMRLLPGLLAGQEGRFELTGDESLRSRPMERIAEPLRQMAVSVETTDGRAPFTVEGGALTPITYELPVASAQVKSAVLLAGLYAEGGETTVEEPLPTRDHTENMLAQAGVRVTRKPRSVSVAPTERLELGDIEVPGDFSSAAPFIVAGTLLAGSELTIHGVNLNPRRTGLLVVLERMGANITVFNRRRIGGEPAISTSARPSSSARRSARPRCRCWSTSCRSSLCSRCTPTATARSAAPPSCAPRSPTGSRQWSTASAASAATSVRLPTASRFAAFRPGSGAAARSTPAVIIGSPCWARSPGSSRGRGWRSKARRQRR